MKNKTKQNSYRTESRTTLYTPGTLSDVVHRLSYCCALPIFKKSQLSFAFYSPRSQFCFESFFCSITGFTQRPIGSNPGSLQLEFSLQPNEYSYFRQDVLEAWAGPQHWKLKGKQKGEIPMNTIVS